MPNIHDHVGSQLIELSINSKSNLVFVVDTGSSVVSTIKERLVKNISKQIQECMLKSRVRDIIQLPELSINIEGYPHTRTIKSKEEEAQDLAMWIKDLEEDHFNSDLPWMNEV